MTKEELNFIKDAFSQIIDDVAGNPDWGDAARAVASNLGTLEKELEEKVIELPSNLDEAATEYANQDAVVYATRKKAFKAGAKWMVEQEGEREKYEQWFLDAYNSIKNIAAIQNGEVGVMVNGKFKKLSELQGSDH